MSRNHVTVYSTQNKFAEWVLEKTLIVGWGVIVLVCWYVEVFVCLCVSLLVYINVKKYK